MGWKIQRHISAQQTPARKRTTPGAHQTRKNIRPGKTSDPADLRMIGSECFEPLFEKREHVTGHF